jgi:hypothetical protein
MQVYAQPQQNAIVYVQQAPVGGQILVPVQMQAFQTLPNTQSVPQQQHYNQIQAAPSAARGDKEEVGGGNNEKPKTVDGKADLGNLVPFLA